MIPLSVYHYTRREIAIERILLSGMIQMGSLGVTNDPRESKDWSFVGTYYPYSVVHLNPYYDMGEVQDAANRIRRNEWWFLSVCRDDPSIDAMAPTGNDYKYGYARSRMWAQYAQNHCGICLEFDGVALHNAIEQSLPSGALLYFGDIQYSDSSASGFNAVTVPLADVQEFGLVEGVRRHIRANHRTFFLEKHLDWQSESEFRWLVNAETATPIQVDISKALTAVIVGMDFPTVYEPTLRKLCDGLDARLMRMSWKINAVRRELWRE